MEKAKFIAYLSLIDALIEEGLIRETPDREDEILIYHIEVDKTVYGVTEGWFSHKKTDFAQDLLENERERTELFEYLKETHGLTPIFSKDGFFSHLERGKTVSSIS